MGVRPSLNKRRSLMQIIRVIAEAGLIETESLRLVRNKPVFVHEGQHSGNERNGLTIDLNAVCGGALRMGGKSHPVTRSPGHPVTVCPALCALPCPVCPALPCVPCLALCALPCPVCPALCALPCPVCPALPCVPCLALCALPCPVCPALPCPALCALALPCVPCPALCALPCHPDTTKPTAGNRGLCSEVWST